MDNTTTTTTTAATVQLWSCEYRMPCGWCKLRNKHCDNMVTQVPMKTNGDPIDPIYPNYPYYPQPTITWDPYTKPPEVYCNTKEDTE